MKAETVYKNSITKWGNNNGIGTISYDSSLDLFTPIKEILNLFFADNINNNVIIVTANNARLDEWASALLTNFNYIDKLGDGLLIITMDSIIFNRREYTTGLVIFDQIDRFYNGIKLEVVKGKYITSKFKLGVTNSPDPDHDTFGIYDACPVIDRVTKLDVITHSIVQNNVEFNIPVELSTQDRNLYNEFTSFIRDTIELFGSFDTVIKCYTGDGKAGISADYFRNELATSKGWSVDIDTSNAYYANIDRYFNPNALYERAKSFTDVIRKRNNLLANNNAKIETILQIINKYKDKKILIINKTGIFARIVSSTINEHIKNNNLLQDIPTKTLFSNIDYKVNEKKGFTIDSSALCVEYHPDIESRPLIDIDTNDYIRYKSGAKQGTVKIFGSKSLNRIANERFTKGYHNVISSTNAIPKDANLEIDFIIITSPECDTLNTFQYRVHRLSFIKNVKILNLFLSNTKEVSKLKHKQALTNNNVVLVNNINTDLIL